MDKTYHENYINSIEVKLFHFRHHRKYIFKAFDIWERAVLRGREEDSQEVLDWYQEMLDFPETITENTTYSDYPKTPSVLEKYL